MFILDSNTASLLGCKMTKIIFGLFLSLFWGLQSQARLHEVELHSTEAVVQFGDATSFNVEGNYLFELNSTWQLLFGLKYDQANSDNIRAGVSLGGVFNFGAADHNNKFYLKPQITIARYDYLYTDNDGFGGFTIEDASDTTTFISLVFGKRFPIFTGGSYTVNYTPAIGVSVPLSNTDKYDTVVSVSVVGLSLVF